MKCTNGSFLSLFLLLNTLLVIRVLLWVQLLICMSFPSLHRLHDQDPAPRNLTLLKEGLSQYFSSSSFVRSKSRLAGKHHNSSSGSSTSLTDDSDSAQLKLFFLPHQRKDGSPRGHYESYSIMLWKIRDQVSLSHIILYNITYSLKWELSISRVNFWIGL